MKPHELADRLSISPATLREWIRGPFGEFLSPSAQGTNGSRRAFNDMDTRILSWIARLRGENVPVHEIVAILHKAQAENWRGLPDLPPSLTDTVAMVPREAVEERVKALEERFRQEVVTLQKERDELRQRLDKSETRNDELQRQVFSLSERIVQLSERLAGLLEREQRRK